MTPEALEKLRYMASREDTPIDEARNAALRYVRNGGTVSSVSAVTIADIRRLADVAMVREAFGPELDALKKEEESKRQKLQEKIGSIDKDREALRNERDALKKQLADLKTHGKAILEFLNEASEVPKKEPEPKRNYDWNPITGFPRTIHFKP